jgi:alpha-tubulin suppressor-like RCC1 family protein
MAIAAGYGQSLALKKDGSIVAWGCGGNASFGQCSVPAEATGAVAIAANFAQGLALVISP